MPIDVLYKVGYNPTFSAPNASLAGDQFIGRGFNVLSGLPLAWRSPCVGAPYTPYKTSSEWRFNDACTVMDTRADNYKYTGTGLSPATIVHSVYTWHATHFFADGDGIFDEPYTGSNMRHSGSYASGSIEVYE